jgi:hypothetical protein
VAAERLWTLKWNCLLKSQPTEGSNLFGCYWQPVGSHIPAFWSQQLYLDNNGVFIRCTQYHITPAWQLT